jgi:GTP cyclohydrolase I
MPMTDRTPLRAADISPIDPVATAVEQLLDALGVRQHEPAHTADTPRRVAAAYRHQLSGYEEDPRLHLAKMFPAPEDPGLVVVSGLTVSSMCAHHMLPITGTATIAYRQHIGANVVGLSKLARLLDGYARRLQVQEQLGYQVASALQEELSPIGAGCIITAEHGCMTLRGVMQKGSRTTTTAWTGDWDVDPLNNDRAAVLAEHNR